MYSHNTTVTKLLLNEPSETIGSADAHLQRFALGMAEEHNAGIKLLLRAGALPINGKERSIMALIFKIVTS